MKKRAVLLVNLGSPDSPAVEDVRNYLREFLMDERVMDVPYLIRFGIVHFGILRSRPKQSAEAYRKIWTAEGSPLIATSRKVRAALEARTGLPVGLAMRYQNPSIRYAIEKLRAEGVTDLFLIPMFPHYAMSSYETAAERVRCVAGLFAPEMSLSVMPPYCDQPGYIDALVASAANYLSQEHDHLLFSFHGLPERHLKGIPPSEKNRRCYRTQCLNTVQAFAERTNLSPDKFSIAFQSRLGREPWLKPYTDHVIAGLARSGTKKLLVICPSFVTDCLETLEEIGIRGRETFLQSGGQQLTLIPCLNEHPIWLDTLKKWTEQWVNRDSPYESAASTIRNASSKLAVAAHCS